MQDQEIAINDIYFSDMKNTFICDEYCTEGRMSVKSMRKAWFPYLISISLFPYVFLLQATLFHKIFIFSTPLLNGGISQSKLLLL